LIVPVCAALRNWSSTKSPPSSSGSSRGARAGRLQPADLAGAGVTITTSAATAPSSGVPIVRAGESAIVGFGRIRDAVVPIDGAPAIRSMLPTDGLRRSSAQ